MKTPDVARRREVAARHHLDVRTLDRALRDGVEALRGMARDRARAALAELNVSPSSSSAESGRAA